MKLKKQYLKKINKFKIQMVRWIFILRMQFVHGKGKYSS